MPVGPAPVSSGGPVTALSEPLAPIENALTRSLSLSVTTIVPPSGVMARPIETPASVAGEPGTGVSAPPAPIEKP